MLSWSCCLDTLCSPHNPLSPSVLLPPDSLGCKRLVEGGHAHVSLAWGTWEWGKLVGRLGMTPPHLQLWCRKFSSKGWGRIEWQTLGRARAGWCNTRDIKGRAEEHMAAVAVYAPGLSQSFPAGRRPISQSNLLPSDCRDPSGHSSCLCHGRRSCPTKLLVFSCPWHTCDPARVPWQSLLAQQSWAGCSRCANLLQRAHQHQNGSSLSAEAPHTEPRWKK